MALNYYHQQHEILTYEMKIRNNTEQKKTLILLFYYYFNFMALLVFVGISSSSFFFISAQFLDRFDLNYFFFVSIIFCCLKIEQNKIQATTI